MHTHAHKVRENVKQDQTQAHRPDAPRRRTPEHVSNVPFRGVPVLRGDAKLDDRRGGQHCGKYVAQTLRFSVQGVVSAASDYKVARHAGRPNQRIN